MGKSYVLAYLDSIKDEDVERYLGATYRISYDNGVTFGSVMLSPVTTPHGPTLLPSGDMIWVGCLHSAEVNNDPATEHERIRAYRLNTSDGSMAEIGKIVFEKNSGLLPCEVHTLALDENRLIAHIRSDTKFNLYQSESSDGGRTWTSPHALNEENGGAPSFLFKQSSGAIIALYGYRELPYGIKAMFSFDEGKTWDTGYTVYESPITDDIGWDIGYPSCIELEDGSLLPLYRGSDSLAAARLQALLWRDVARILSAYPGGGVPSVVYSALVRRANTTEQSCAHPWWAVQTIRLRHCAFRGCRGAGAPRPFCQCQAPHQRQAPWQASRPTAAHSNRLQPHRLRDAVAPACVSFDGTSFRPLE